MLKINKNELEILLLIIPFLGPEGLLDVVGGPLEVIFNLWRVASFGWILLKVIMNKMIKPDVVFVLVILYGIETIYSCLENNKSIEGRVVCFANMIGVYMIMYFFSKYNPKGFIAVTFNWLFFLIVLNGIMTILCPSGLNNAMSNTARINLLGMDNMITLMFLLTNMYADMYAKLFPKSSRPMIAFVLTVIMQIYYFSGSGMVAFTVVVIYVVFLNKNPIVRKFAKPLYLFCLYLALEVLIVGIGSIDYFSFIFDWLGKDITFTDRTYYWSRAIEQILESPYIGIGDGKVDLWSGRQYSHNAILDVLMKGGIIGLILWFMLVLFSYFNINKIEHTQKKEIGVISVLVFAAFLVGLMEGLEDRMAFVFIIATASVYSKLIEDCSREYKIDKMMI